MEFTKINRLMPFEEVHTVYCENHKEAIKHGVETCRNVVKNVTHKITMSFKVEGPRTGSDGRAILQLEGDEFHCRMWVLDCSSPLAHCPMMAMG
jgi:hypothetical protein